MVAQRLPECLPGLSRQWWVCGRQVGAGLEILLGLLWPHCPVPRFPPVEKEDDPTLSAMAPNVTVEGTTPGPVAGEREKQAGASPPRPAPPPGHHAPQVDAAGFLFVSLSLAVS